MIGIRSLGRLREPVFEVSDSKHHALSAYRNPKYSVLGRSEEYGSKELPNLRIAKPCATANKPEVGPIELV